MWINLVILGAASVCVCVVEFVKRGNDVGFFGNGPWVDKQPESHIDVLGGESKELERQACALVKQYGMVLMMAPPVKVFFKRLAVFLKWEQLEKMV